MFRSALHYAQFARGLFAAHRYPFRKDLEATLRDQLHHRESRFLDILRRVILENPAHPQHKMLLESRCEFGDIESLISRQGLEATLGTLRTAGIYVSQEEFKGRQPIVRNGKHIPGSTTDFVNPFAAGAWRGLSSGSTGPPVSVPANLEHAAHRECYRILALRQFGAPERMWISMSPILPTVWGVTRHMWNLKSGLRIQHWFAAPGSRPEARWHRFGTRVLLAEMRLLGVPTPPLTFLPLNDFLPVAREIADARRRGTLSFITGSASYCTRVATTATENGLDISGARFWIAGEALTPGKAAAIRRAGAESYATYWTSEFGALGIGCQHYEGENTVHHFRDSHAIVTARQPVPATGAEVNAMFFTPLLPFAPIFALNLELGDHGVISPARCSCCFSKLGFDTVISDIYSYSKLTGHGITLAGTEIVRLLEQTLPARFGGSPSDYQLEEQEAGTETHVVLRVDPRIGTVPAGDIEQFFLDEARKLFGGSLAVRMWSHAGAVKVLREPPLAGRTGKVLPLHLLGRGTSRKRPETVHAP